MIRPAALLLLLTLAWPAAQASGLRYCEQPAPLSAEQQDKLLRFADIIKAELDGSGQRLALVARSGLDLRRFGQRYSHAGFSLKDSDNSPWSVRQLYYACDEEKPRIYDQGMPGFLLGSHTPTIGYLSVVLLPSEESAALTHAALDKGLALQMLSPNYSANAYPFSLRYQNCNQWVAEMLAATWAPVSSADGDSPSPREQAQQWLQVEGYVPSVFELGWRPLMWLGAFVPWVHNDDHPAEDIAEKRYRVSMPAAIEAFVQKRVPAARRVEFCHTERVVVIRRGWAPIAEGCVAGAQDTVIVF